MNKFKKFIRVYKDALPHHAKNNVMYKIMCKECNAKNVGQTSRQLKTRISEYKLYNWNQTTRSIIINYRMQYNHEFD